MKRVRLSAGIGERGRELDERMAVSGRCSSAVSIYSESEGAKNRCYPGRLFFVKDYAKRCHRQAAQKRGTISKRSTSTNPRSVILSLGMTGKAMKPKAIKGSDRGAPSSWATWMMASN